MKSTALSFGRALTVRHVEDGLKDLVRTANHLVIDLTECQHVDLGAGYRLGLAMRLFNGKLTVRVPAVDQSGSFSGNWFRLFTRSGLGWAMSQHASQVLAGDRDIAAALRAYHDRDEARPSANFMALVRLERGSVVDVNDMNRFHEQVLGGMKTVAPDLLQELRSGSANGEELIQPLLRLCFEAIQNVYDHSTRKPLEAGVTVASRFCVARYSTASAPADGIGGFKEYLDRLPATSSGFTPRPQAFVDLLVSDDGVGIAARQSQSLAIYEGPIESEDQALIAGLSDGSSVKLVARDSVVRGDPGFGFSYVRESLQKLTAFAQVRSGRRLLTFDPTLASGGNFTFHEDLLGYLPGTAVHVTIPIKVQQPSLLGI